MEFNQVIAELIDEKYGGDLEAALEDLEQEGFDAESIISVLEGDLVPDEDSLVELGQSLGLTDEVQFENLLDIADEAEALLEEELDDEDYEDDIESEYDEYEDDEDFEEDEYEDDIESEYDEYDDDDYDNLVEQDYEDNSYYAEDEYENDAEYDAEYDDNAGILEDQLAVYQSQVSDLEDQLAEFSYNNELYKTLTKLSEEAEELINQHKLTYAEYEGLFGELAEVDPDEAVATFGAYNQEEAVSDETQLYAIQKYLAVASLRDQFLPDGTLAGDSSTGEFSAGGYSNEYDEQELLDEIDAASVANYFESGDLKI